MTDDDGARRRFDPRFDPAFQPGYDPRNDPAAPARSVPSRRAAIPRTNEPPEAPPAYARAQHLAPEEVGPAASARASQVAGDSEAVAPLPVTTPPPDAEPPARGVNPFSLAVWVISVLLLVAGIAIYRALPAITEESSSSAGAANNFIQLFTLGVLASVIVGVGLIGIVGNLLLLARRFEHRR